MLAPMVGNYSKQTAATASSFSVSVCGTFCSHCYDNRGRKTVFEALWILDPQNSPDTPGSPERTPGVPAPLPL